MNPRMVAGGASALLATMLVPLVAAAQVEREIGGVVRDGETGQPLAGAVVMVVPAAATGAVSHGDGTFYVVAPDSGQFSLRVERLGYRTAILDVDASTVDWVEVDMVASPIDLSGVVVTGSLVARAANEMLRPASVYAGDRLQRRLAGTVAATLSREPGVAVSTMGPNSAHPVIRGLSGERILVLEDGERVGDDFSSAPDHATALDPSTARRIEVIRGPGAILYGSNALGGVLNVVRDDVPSVNPHHFTGTITLQGQSATSATSASVNAMVGVTDHIPARLEFTHRTSGDLKTPVGALSNTSASVTELSGGTSWVDQWGHAGLSFRYYDNDYGIPGGFVGGHQDGVRIDMQRAATRLKAIVRPQGRVESVEIDAGHTWYRHLEIEPPDIVGTVYERQAASGEVLARHETWGPFSSGGFGTRASWQSLGFGGSLSTPNSTRASFAVFGLEEIDLDPVRLEAGLRYDWEVVRPRREDPASDIGHIRARSFSALSGSLGALSQLGERTTLGTSIARAFRAPSVAELFSEGPHLAAYSFEVGNPELETEKGTGVDIFARYAGDRLSVEVTLFRNAISGFVFPLKTGEVSRVLLPVYQFRGEDAVFTGLEHALRWAPAGDMTVEAVASYVRGNIVTAGEPLPRIPPLQGSLGIGYAPPDWFAEAETRFAARQDRTGPLEEATDGYVVFDLSAGIRFTFGGRLNVVTIRGENVGNVEYRNHLSRVKEIMPEAGRSLGATYRVVF